MTRSDLITVLASRFPSFLAKDAEIAVKEILAAIIWTMGLTPFVRTITDPWWNLAAEEQAMGPPTASASSGR